MITEEEVNYAVNNTKIINIGKGTPILFVNGGPGFDHNYFKTPLSYLSDQFELIFYDQPGCGETKSIFPELTLDNAGKHLACLIQHFSSEQELTIVAHSWGCIVLLSALSKYTNTSKIKKTILIAPMPWHVNGYEESRKNLIEKIPTETFLDFCNALQEEKNGTEVMSYILEYYTPNKISLTPSDFNLITKTFNQVNASLDSFDYRYEFSTFENLSIIIGEHDFIGHQQIQKLIQDKHQMRVLNNLGHFPFYEDHNIFKATLDEILQY